jgi:hypothetical protein
LRPAIAITDEGLMSSIRSSGPQVRTIAGLPSSPSFTISALCALMIVSMLNEGCISKKLSRPWRTPFSTSSASIRLPPKVPVKCSSRCWAFCTTKRATSFASRKSPAVQCASGPVGQSAGSLIRRARALGGSQSKRYRRALST